MDVFRCWQKNESGSVYVEEVVLLTLVALGFALATSVLGPALMKYHAGIELVLSFPVP
jgi:Flp pilus assembly pilin Flp